MDEQTKGDLIDAFAELLDDPAQYSASYKQPRQDWAKHILWDCAKAFAQVAREQEAVALHAWKEKNGVKDLDSLASFVWHTTERHAESALGRLSDIVAEGKSLLDQMDHLHKVIQAVERTQQLMEERLSKLELQAQ